MRVLIVARTKMGGVSRCIGALVQDGSAVRLLTSAGDNHTTASPMGVGEVWELSYKPRPDLVPPHVEDVIVTQQQLVEVQSGLRQHLLGRVQPWRGSIDKLFGGVLGYTGNDNGYVSEPRGVPDRSTGFWIPNSELVLRGDKKHYDYVEGYGAKGMSYVGEPDALERIPAGTLVRVSLARWWKPDDADETLEERCYLQLSGWY